jgi:CBS domain-containing protein
MWWPALGGLAVGLVGYVAPRTLGVGYTNIEDAVNGRLFGAALLVLVVAKLISWAVSLGSGTSGGTLAPLLTIGGGIGGLLGGAAAHLWPGLGIDPRLAALVGMAALFAGASRALLASVVFAFETTLQPSGILPLLAGCSASYLLSSLLMRNTIMTEKIARRGVRVPAEYAADLLASVPVRSAMTAGVYTLRADEPLTAVRAFLASHAPHAAHQGYPVLDGAGRLVGVVTRRDLLDPEASGDASVSDLVKRAPLVVRDDETLREAADRMVLAGVGRLPVVRRDDPRTVVGILTRGDLLAAQRPRLEEARRPVRHIVLGRRHAAAQARGRISASAALTSAKRNG